MAITFFSPAKGDVILPGPATIQTVDPVASNDVTQGYIPGSIWVNTANNRLWICISNAQGAALWAFSGAVPGYAEPSGVVTQFGSGSGSFAEEGNMYRMISGAGINPGGTAQDYVTAAFAIPASSFDIANRGLNIIAQGGFANNANTKRCKIIVNPSSATVGAVVGSGGVTIADTGSYSTAAAVGWALEANVFKYGAAGSNTQLGIHTSAQMGSSIGQLLPPSLLTATESGAILVAITGNAGTAAADITLNFVEANAMN